MNRELLLKVCLRAAAESLAEVKEAPAGVLYAGLMGQGITLDDYNIIESLLIKYLKVAKRGDVLTWTAESQAILDSGKAAAKARA